MLNGWTRPLKRSARHCLVRRCVPAARLPRRSAVLLAAAARPRHDESGEQHPRMSICVRPFQSHADDDSIDNNTIAVMTTMINKATHADDGFCDKTAQLAVAAPACAVKQRSSIA
eukprot:6173983-Pleurochrysis_carterae.AAC.2